MDGGAPDRTWLELSRAEALLHRRASTEGIDGECHREALVEEVARAPDERAVDVHGLVRVPGEDAVDGVGRDVRAAVRAQSGQSLHVADRQVLEEVDLRRH